MISGTVVSAHLLRGISQVKKAVLLMIFNVVVFNMASLGISDALKTRRIEISGYSFSAFPYASTHLKLEIAIIILLSAFCWLQRDIVNEQLSDELGVANRRANAQFKWSVTAALMVPMVSVLIFVTWQGWLVNPALACAISSSQFGLFVTTVLAINIQRTTLDAIALQDAALRNLQTE